MKMNLLMEWPGKWLVVTTRQIHVYFILVEAHIMKKDARWLAWHFIKFLWPCREDEE